MFDKTAGDPKNPHRTHLPGAEGASGPVQRRRCAGL